MLFAAIDSASLYHEAARAFLNDHTDSDRFGLCELVLVELYGLLRNPVVVKQPLSAGEAAKIIQRFRSHPRWLLFDYPGPESAIMKQFWHRVAGKGFPYKRIYDLRLALTLRHHGVVDFATRNVKDFEGVGFKEVWDPFHA